MATKQRLLCDTNYLLDVFDPERAAHADAVALLWYQTENPDAIELVAPIASFKDAYYILSRLYKDEQLARASIEGIMDVFVTPVDMLASYGAEALASGEPDFEDALVRACAEHEGAATLITRDERAFRESPVPALSAAAFLERQGFSYAEVDF